MTGRLALNVGLVVALAALGGLWVFRSHWTPRPEAPIPLTPLAPSDLARVTLKRPGAPDVVFVRDGHDWNITAPIHARADRFRVQHLLGLVGAPTLARFPATPARLARFGLDRPTAILEVNGETLAFGALNPITQGRYVRYRHDIAVVPGLTTSPARLVMDDFLDSRVLPAHAPLVALQLPGFRLTLKDGQWRLTPPRRHLPTDALTDFVDRWRYARALSVRQHAPPRHLGDVRVTVRGPGHTRRHIVLRIAEESPSLILYRVDRHLAYQFPGEMRDALLQITHHP